jgi:bacterioferritin-associated ferredoxin
MIICHCLNLTDRDIRAGITPSASNACGGCCGSCRSTIDAILSRSSEPKDPSRR